MSLDYNKNMIPRAKSMRRSATKHEALLWYRFLRRYPLRFQRQKTIGSYIVDFYCYEAALVIELDGSQHYEKHAKAYDDERTRYLEAAGLRVIRFSNAMIDRDFVGVCAAIEREIRVCVAAQADK